MNGIKTLWHEMKLFLRKTVKLWNNRAADIVQHMHF